MEQRLDTYSKFPSGMQEYLESYGFHFSKKLYEWAVSKMKVKDEATGKEKKLDPWSKDEVDDMLKANGINIEHDKGYDVSYVANMLKADFFKKSLVDEAHLCKHIKCYLDDIDGDPCRAFEGFPQTCVSQPDRRQVEYRTYLFGLQEKRDGNGALFDFYPRTISKFVGPRKRSFMPAYLQGFRN